MSSVRRGVYPGSFNPPTRAHLAISNAARLAHDLETVVWTVSRVALAKEHVEVPSLEHRLEVLHEVATLRSWLEVEVTDAQLLVDISDGYDLLIMGADKWHQIQDPVFYSDSIAQRDAAMAALPAVAVAPRPPHRVPAPLLLDVPRWAAEVSSSHARAGNHAMMLPEAIRFDRATGAWTEPARYSGSHRR